jgi:hypothetical protein
LSVECVPFCGANIYGLGETLHLLPLKFLYYMLFGRLIKSNLMLFFFCAQLFLYTFCCTYFRGDELGHLQQKKLMKTLRPHSFYKIMKKILYWDLTYLCNCGCHYSHVGLSDVFNNGPTKKQLKTTNLDATN